MIVRLIFVLLIFTCLNTMAEVSNIRLEDTYISGNQELPKVLYVLPWKHQQGAVLEAYSPSFDALEITPVYPHEYRRELRIRQLVNINTLSVKQVNRNPISNFNFRYFFQSSSEED